MLRITHYTRICLGFHIIPEYAQNYTLYQNMFRITQFQNMYMITQYTKYLQDYPIPEYVQDYPEDQNLLARKAAQAKKEADAKQAASKPKISQSEEVTI